MTRVSAGGIGAMTLLAFLLTALLVSTLVFSPPTVFAKNGCDATITTSTTLTSDIGPCPGDGLKIVASGVVLDCAGHTIAGSGTGNGIELFGPRTGNLLGVTVKNCRVSGFGVDFELIRIEYSTLAANDANASDVGFQLRYSARNILLGNTATHSTDGFFVVHHSRYNSLTGNVAVNDTTGFQIYDASSNNNLTRNTADYDAWGFSITGSPHNNLTGNTGNHNRVDGFRIEYASRTILRGNTADYNAQSGFWLNGYRNRIQQNFADYNGQYGYQDNARGMSGTYHRDECSLNGLGGSSPRGLCGPQK